MNRRDAVLALLALGGLPCASYAQTGRVYRIGWPIQWPKGAASANAGDAFLQGLRDLGYTPGKNIIPDVRYGDGKLEHYPAVIQEVVQGKPDVILMPGNAYLAKAATQTIPIIMVMDLDPVGSGVVSSLAKPGGNITGLTWDVGGDPTAKRLEHLKEISPGIKRVARLWEPPFEKLFAEEIKRAASVMGIEVFWQEVTEDIEGSIAAAAKKRAGALLVASNARLYIRRNELVSIANKYRLPASYNLADFVEAGGLMSYSPNIPDLFRRAAGYVDKILKGAKPADLPIERPTKLELAINLKTAKALGLKVPDTLLIRADHLIE
jgi:putative ABC transport system substrate-binding protein